MQLPSVMSKTTHEIYSGKALSADLQKLGMGINYIPLKDRILSKYKSVENLKDKASHFQDWEAQHFLSMAYEYGEPELNIIKDLNIAITWLESSLRNGNDSNSEKCHLGALYDSRGTILDQRRAFELYLECARKGVVQGQLNVAEVYRCGIEGVVNKDLEEAFKWYRCAAGEESMDDVDVGTNSLEDFMKDTYKSLGIDFKIGALRKLHKYYMIGDCPERKPQPIKALCYLKKAAELGDSEAQRDLGLSYLEGERGQPKDANRAKRWIKKAASNGDQEAEEILRKLNDQNTIEKVLPEPVLKNNAQQYCEFLKTVIKDRQQWHPYVVNNFKSVSVDLFKQFPNSPTAQHFTKALELLQKGFKKLGNCSESDEGLNVGNPDFENGIKMMAQGFLYENSIVMPFVTRFYYSEVQDLIFRTLKIKPNFFEGLLFLFASYPINKRFNIESCKVDLKRTMFLNNIIHLIKKAEPNMPPTEDPYFFDQNYSSWLHHIYYFLGSNYIIADCCRDGAEVFQKALDCCPKFSKAKLPLGHCLLSMSLREQIAGCPEQKDQVLANPDERLLETFAMPKEQRILKGDYLTWTKAQLRQKAKLLFMEYLQEVPECDKMYQEGHYNLAYLNLIEGNIEEALNWKEKGEDSEERRLPFLSPFKSAFKEQLRILDIIQIPKKYTTKRHSQKTSHAPCRPFSSLPNDTQKGACKGSQRETKQSCTHCSNSIGELKRCPCKNASYCGSVCQKADWKEHKKACTSKKQNKTKS